MHWQVDPLPLSHQAVNGFPGDSVVKNPPANAGDTGSIPGSVRSPGEEMETHSSYSCLEYPMDIEALATSHGVTKSQT